MEEENLDMVSKPKFKSITMKCKIKTIAKFVPLISIEDLDPEFNDIVNKNFWELI